MPRTLFGRATVLLASVACAAAVAGCNSNPSPAPLPSESPSASAPSEASSSPAGPTAPTLPAEAKGTSEKSAKAFVRYWVATLNFAGATGDTERLREISAKDCASCDAVITSIDRVYGANGYYKGKGWSIANLKYQPLQPDKRPVLTVSVVIASQKVLEKPGAEPTNFKGGNRSMTFRLNRHDSTWTLLQLDQPT